MVMEMSWDALAAVAEAVGAVGVMLTLLYLALQTRQNTNVLEQTRRMHEAGMYRANADGVMNLQSILAQDEKLALIWKNGLADEDLSDIEVARFESYLNMLLFDQEHKLYLTEVGTFDEVGGVRQVMRHIEGQINFLMQSQLVRSWWENNADRTFGAVFVAEVNRIANS